MKNIKMPAKYSALDSVEQQSLGGGYGVISGAVLAAAKFFLPESKIAGESRGGYYPTYILVPEAVFWDYAALKVYGFLYRAAGAIERMGL